MLLSWHTIWPMQVLAELHEKIPPFPRDVAMEIVEKELGYPVEKAFGYISEEPVASASFGQVIAAGIYIYELLHFLKG